jgi:hypothetical protein
MYEPVVLADPVSRLKKSLVEPVALLAPAPVPKRLLLFVQNTAAGLVTPLCWRHPRSRRRRRCPPD